jgi:hypothetical protein
MKATIRFVLMLTAVAGFAACSSTSSDSPTNTPSSFSTTSFGSPTTGPESSPSSSTTVFKKSVPDSSGGTAPSQP